MLHLPTLWLMVTLLAIHWIADFVCQTHWQASNKSKNNDALSRHVLSYTAVLLFAASILFGIGMGLIFATINGILHFITDYFTSRWSAKLYAKQDWHNFFVVIGFDQLIHQSTIAATIAWMAR